MADSFNEKVLDKINFEYTKKLESALADMVNQFADTDKEERYLYTGGLSALENAFDVLNIQEGTKREEIWKKIK